MSRGGGIPVLEIKKGFLVDWFRGFCFLGFWLLGFVVLGFLVFRLVASWCLGLWFLGFTVSQVQSFNAPILQQSHFMFSGRY